MMFTADEFSKMTGEQKKEVLRTLSDVYIGTTDAHDFSNWSIDENGKLILLDAPNDAFIANVRD